MKTIRTLTFLFLAFLTNSGIGQNIGINSSGALPDNSAGLDVSFTNKGMLLPRVALIGTNDIFTIPSAATSLLVYNTATSGTAPNNVTPGYYYWTGTVWTRVLNGSVNAWSTSGNSGTIEGTNFIGTTDARSILFKVNNQQSGKLDISNFNTSFGIGSNISNTIGIANTAVGYEALTSNTSGTANLSIGHRSLVSNTIGSYNVGLGFFALANNTTGSENIAIGRAMGTGWANNTGSNNISLGTSCLGSNTSGSNNVAIGAEAMKFNTTGDINIAIGSYTLQSNTTGVGNVAICNGAAGNNTSGYYNIAIGASAMTASTSGDHNIAIGSSAFYNNVTGQSNTVLGSFAGFNSTGNNNTFLGTSADVTTAGINNSTAIGYNAKVSISNAIVLGTAFENIGIGLSAPTEKLHVNGRVKIGAYTLPDTDGLTGQVLKTNGSGTLSWSTDNSNAGTVTSVALSMPSVFSVSGSPVTSSGTLSATLATQTANTVFAGPSSGGAATPTFRTLVAADIPTNLSGYIQNATVGGNFATGQSASFDITGNAEISGTLEINGNMGIGTTTSTKRLTISGTESTAHGFGSCIALANTAAGGGEWFLRSGATGTSTPAAGFSIADNTAYRMVIDNSGNIGINTTAPTQRLHVVGNGLFTGTVTASCGTLVCSDQRYKQNIHPLTGSLNKINSLNGYSYFMRKEEFPELNFSDQKQIGFIAQELEQVFPEMVYTDEKGYKTVNYQAMTPVLLEAIKEQQIQIDELKKLVEQLIQHQTK